MGPLVSTPFISRTDLSDYLGRDVTADNGAIIVTDAACEMVRTATEQSFTAGTSTVTLDGTGTDTLLLPELPVSSLGTISIRGATVDPQFYALRDDGVVCRVYSTATTSSQPLFSDDWQFVTGSSELKWPLGRQNITVSYVHGYSEVPEDIRMVALSLASRMIVQGAASSETVGDVSVRYGVNSTDFTDGEKMILRKHRPAR